MSVKPVRPSEIVELKKNIIPSVVIQQFNEMIAEDWSGGSATIKQDAVIKRITENSDLTREQIFNRHYLDVEDIFREAGWKVVYDKPGYNESYDAFFRFTAR